MVFSAIRTLFKCFFNPKITIPTDFWLPILSNLCPPHPKKKTIEHVDFDTLKPVGHQSTNWMARLAFMEAMAALTSLGTTSPRYSRHTAMYLPLRGSHWRKRKRRCINSNRRKEVSEISTTWNLWTTSECIDIGAFLFINEEQIGIKWELKL